MGEGERRRGPGRALVRNRYSVVRSGDVGVSTDTPARSTVPTTRPLGYSVNVTPDGCCDHRAAVPSEALHRYAAENIAPADALLFGRVTHQMMEEAWRLPEGAEDEAEEFAWSIHAARKYVVSDSVSTVNWNAELIARVDLEAAVRRLKDEPGEGLFVGGPTMPLPWHSWG